MQTQAQHGAGMPRGSAGMRSIMVGRFLASCLLQQLQPSPACGGPT